MIIAAPRYQPFTHVIQGLWTPELELLQWPTLKNGDFLISPDSKTWVPLMYYPTVLHPEGYRVRLDFTRQEMSRPIVFMEGESATREWRPYRLMIVTREEGKA